MVTVLFNPTIGGRRRSQERVFHHRLRHSRRSRHAGLVWASADALLESHAARRSCLTMSAAGTKPPSSVLESARLPIGRGRHEGRRLRVVSGMHMRACYGTRLLAARLAGCRAAQRSAPDVDGDADFRRRVEMAWALRRKQRPTTPNSNRDPNPSRC